MVIVFSIERFLTIRKALGNGSISDFIRKVQYHLANRNVDAALSECDKQRGSVANVMKAGLRRYKEMINEGRNGHGTKSDCHSKRSGGSDCAGIANASKKPGISFYHHFGRYPGSPVGYGIGYDQIIFCPGCMKAGAACTAELAVGISEALYNTALGIGTSALALIMYNIFTTKIDSITYGIDESGFTLTQSFASQYK